MKMTPLVTEKSLARAKLGKYSFVVPIHTSSGQVRQKMEEIFPVKVEKVWTLKQAAETYRSRNRSRLTKAARKVAIVSLKSGKIDIFEALGEAAEKDEKVKSDSGGKKV